nr:unnamed protein product [Callosobruchus analis]
MNWLGIRGHIREKRTSHVQYATRNS